MADVEMAQSPRTTSVAAAETSSVFSLGKKGIIFSFVVLIIGFIIAIITQSYAPNHINMDSWTKGCPDGYTDACKANSAVLRVSFALSILFACQMIGSAVVAMYFDVLWGAKFIVFGCILIGFFFADADVFDLHGYAWYARIMGFFFLILQQIILLDVAYTWNERWLAYASEDGEKGKKYLYGIIIFSLILFSGSITVIGLLFWQFDQCTSNNVIISLTLVLSFIATMVQLFLTDQGSLLTSAIMTAYATYVCYSSVTLNPNPYCNPTLNSGYQTIATVIGLVLTIISLTWTTYSTVIAIPVATNKDTGTRLSLVDVVTGGGGDKKADEPVDPSGVSVNAAPSAAPVGSATTTSGAAAPAGTDMHSDDPYSAPGLKTLFVQVSLIFLLISGYFAMILTNWATLQTTTSISNPKTGEVAMWIQAAGQWIAIIIYLWSLVAPKILTNREF